MNPYYREYGDMLTARFGTKVQKISVSTDARCPNRDGTKGTGGCIYCNNKAFTPPYASAGTDIDTQLEHGIAFFSHKYPRMRYLAYFQSYTSTHADHDTIMQTYTRAAAHPGVVGLVIGTRPDCMPPALLERLARLNRRTPVMVEYGAETSHDTTLRAINRCHTWADTTDAVMRTAAAGIDTGLHLIAGLPGETDDMILDTIRLVNTLPVTSVKFHQLQIVRGTPLARMVQEGTITVSPYTLNDYIDLCIRIIHTLRSDIAIDRFTSQTPPALLIAPQWGLKNHEFTHLLHRALKSFSPSRTL